MRFASLSVPFLVGLALTTWVRAQAPSALEALEQKVRQDSQSGAPTPPNPATTSPAASSPTDGTSGRGYAGLVADDQADRGRGVRILQIVPGGPAEKAGLQPQDLITALGGVRVRQLSDMAMILEQAMPGQTLEFEVLRGEESKHVTLTFGRPPARGTAAKPAPEPPRPPLPGNTTPAASGANQDAAQARIEQLERRLGQLEQRIQALERVLGISPAK